MITIKISEYSTTPGHRSRDDGPFSGDEFLENHLRPKFLQARETNSRITVDLDGTAGYATSFLEAAFGGLAREFPVEEVLQTIDFVSQDEPYLPTEIKDYIREARD